MTPTSQFTPFESNGLVYKPHPRFLTQNFGKKVRIIHEFLRYMDGLRLRMQSQTLDLLALSETRLDNTFTDSAVSIDGYTLIRRDRCRGCGDVAMYVRNVIDFKIRSDLSDPDLEFLCIEIQKPRAKPFHISNWYRPSNSPIELFGKFEVLLAKIEAENVESNILGDINCDMMAVTPANETRHLIELCELFQSTQLIKEPTRVTSSAKSLIDLFLTNEPVKLLHQVYLLLVAAIIV